MRGQDCSSEEQVGNVAFSIVQVGSKFGGACNGDYTLYQQLSTFLVE